MLDDASADPSLSEILSDPITQSVMRADGVSYRDVIMAMQHVDGGRELMSPAAPSSARETGGLRSAAQSRRAANSQVKASDAMTAKVVSVFPDTPVQQIARKLVENSISAVPVIDESGSLIGMISEVDLLPRRDAEREARRDWWLALLAEGEALSPGFLAGLRASHREARDIMSTPVVTVGPDTDVTLIARLLVTYRIKRVPVVRDARLIGIVSRADLLGVLAKEPPFRSSATDGGFLASALASLDEHFLATRQSETLARKPRIEHDEPSRDHLQVKAFQQAVSDFEHKEVQQRVEARRVVVEQRQRTVTKLLGEHITDEVWQKLLQEASEAAEHGQKEFLLLRFPSQLCTDGGRAVNLPDPNWPATLRGESAEIYLRWQRDLKPGGFHLSARVVEFPDGLPGDIGLFLVWGK